MIMTLDRKLKILVLLMAEETTIKTRYGHEL